MAKLIIVDGHRLTGKSTVTRELRNRINYATLVNPTGFPDKGQRGLAKIASYYQSWTDLLDSFKEDDTLFIFDRYMTSEKVFSELYKDYDFSPYYSNMLNRLVSAGHEVHFFLLELDSNRELVSRATGRNKALFAGVPESLGELLNQREGYRLAYEDLQSRNLPKWKLHKLDVEDMSTEQVVQFIISKYEEEEE